jgi:hypothetical protein
MKFRRTVLSVSIASAITTLSACGGGGGGGAQNHINLNNQIPVQPTSSPVPYYAPTRVGSITPINSPEREYDSSALYSQSFSGNGQELLIAGRMAPDSGTYYNYNLNIFGWANGTLINKTSQWFSGTDNVIVGTEPSVQFADFDNDGKIDIFVAPNTDTNQATGPGVLFYNNGSSFTRSNIDLSNTNAHGSAVYDLNHDGYMDIVTTGVRVAFGGPNRSFTVYTPLNNPGSGASISIADFLGNGTSTIITTDVGSNGVQNNQLYSWSRVGNDIVFQLESFLPTPRFLLPKWASYNFAGSHDIRSLAFDFDNSGRIGAVIFSKPALTNGYWHPYSEIQFLKNHGGGIFTDVTDNTLVGYNTSTPSAYNPTLADINNDGLIDIVLGVGNWESNAGAQVLIHTAEHKYVASYATVLQAFQDQATNLERNLRNTVEHGANGIVFVRGPDGAMYLATAVSYAENNQQQKAIYLSKLGTGAVSAQATATSIRQTWPWMSDAQVNTVLAQSSTTWFGLNVLDPNKALNPIGSLSLPVNGQLMSLSGYIGGINLNGVANRISVIDSVGRDFTVNYSATNTPGIVNLWSKFVENIDDDTRGAQVSGIQSFRYQGFKFGGTPDNRNMVVGLTGIDLGKNTSLSVQYTRMPFSPFVQLNGSWGLVKSSSTMESTITNRQGGFVNKLGLMYSSTEIEQGLVNRVNPISSVWAETGYEWKHFRAYAGMLPKVVGGTADINLPTGVDNRGQVQYTNTRSEVYSPTVHYARFNYTDRINRYANYRINAMITTQQQHTVMGEIRINF